MHRTYWESVWDRFCKHRLGVMALGVLVLFCFFGIYAPFFASSKPIFVQWRGAFYFPLFRYLFYPGFYTKGLDIFFNILMFTLPPFILLLLFCKARLLATLSFLAIQLGAFFYCMMGNILDPASNPILNQMRQYSIQEQLAEGKKIFPSWDFDLKYMTEYAKLNMVVRYQLLKEQHERLQPYEDPYVQAEEARFVQKTVQSKLSQLQRQGKKQHPGQLLKALSDDELLKQFHIPTLFAIHKRSDDDELARQKRVMRAHLRDSESYQFAEAKQQYILDKREWLEEESQHLNHLVMPFIRSFHWEDDAGGGQSLNQHVPWHELTRINRKDLVAALIFGIRISLVVGLTAVTLALLIGIPIGSLAGYYGGKFDIIVSRLLEIWEAMPTFFMLLLVVAITQSKSIFLVISVIGLFAWTSFSRYIRGEFFKQRGLAYVEACSALGYTDSRIIFSHILPNAIPPILTLIPFAMMAAITSEAGLSFLGLGEEGSTSWGVLMDEGRSAFPGESYLLWPPAILLVILLVAIALVGDALRDTLDPKMRK